MADITLTIPNNKVQLVLDAFSEVRGIFPTPGAVKQEFVDDIKQTVKQYLLRLSSGQDTSLTAADMEVNVT